MKTKFDKPLTKTQNASPMSEPHSRRRKIKQQRSRQAPRHQPVQQRVNRAWHSSKSHGDRAARK